ncbi:hypothetical protein BS50DRAFT_647486 [Corynespora cassiicola Philippines]|uniref:Uncharacterized protein n=1 Tax=Corynespora cassiicola Philippines TaxID=1448308 RepID=A0A2T2NFB6_CORCC|nr:hypothetical protein BS50DRAFT_647486 [Corynespora cassiicola Philippines]
MARQDRKLWPATLLAWPSARHGDPPTPRHGWPDSQALQAIFPPRKSPRLSAAVMYESPVDRSRAAPAPAPARVCMSACLHSRRRRRSRRRRSPTAQPCVARVRVRVRCLLLPPRRPILATTAVQFSAPDVERSLAPCGLAPSRWVLAGAMPLDANSSWPARAPIPDRRQTRNGHLCASQLLCAASILVLLGPSWSTGQPFTPLPSVVRARHGWPKPIFIHDPLACSQRAPSMPAHARPCPPPMPGASSSPEAPFRVHL